MNKFNVGDTVRVVNPDNNSLSHGLAKGYVGTISAVQQGCGEDGYCYWVDNMEKTNRLTRLYSQELELVESAKSSVITAKEVTSETPQVKQPWRPRVGDKVRVFRARPSLGIGSRFPVGAVCIVVSDPYSVGDSTYVIVNSCQNRHSGNRSYFLDELEPYSEDCVNDSPKATEAAEAAQEPIADKPVTPQEKKEDVKTMRPKFKLNDFVTVTETGSSAGVESQIVGVEVEGDSFKYTLKSYEDRYFEEKYLLLSAIPLTTLGQQATRLRAELKEVENRIGFCQYHGTTSFCEKKQELITLLKSKGVTSDLMDAAEKIMALVGNQKQPSSK